MSTKNTINTDWDEGLEMEDERPSCEKHGPMAAGAIGFYCEDCAHEAAVRFPDQQRLNHLPHKKLLAHYRTLVTRQSEDYGDLGREMYEIAITQVEEALLVRMTV